LAPESLVQAADNSVPEAPAIMVAAAIIRFGRLGLLVNYAGATKRGEFFSFSDDDWNEPCRSIAVSLNLAFNCSTALLKRYPRSIRSGKKFGRSRFNSASTSSQASSSAVVENTGQTEFWRSTGLQADLYFGIISLYGDITPRL
jgi:NAD(P)-dependent dehydrogenase (short-subunit alcohol dehydrogenase family)